ncbi:hypothetical protein D3C85_953490 [compost metagenome]
MSTMANKVEDLLSRAKHFVDADTEGNGFRSVAGQLVKELADKVREYHPIVNPPVPVIENPNVVNWRPMVKEGLEKAVAEIQTVLGKHTTVTATTHIRRSVMKDGGIKAKLGIKFESKYAYTRAIDPVKIIQRKVNEVLASHGLPFAAVLTTSGSQMSFSARVYLEGDEDYTLWKRIGRL